MSTSELKNCYNLLYAYFENDPFSRLQLQTRRSRFTMEHMTGVGSDGIAWRLLYEETLYRYKRIVLKHDRHAVSYDVDFVETDTDMEHEASRAGDVSIATERGFLTVSPEILVPIAPSTYSCAASAICETYCSGSEHSRGPFEETIAASAASYG